MAEEGPGDAPPSADEARGWVGFTLDAADGASVGRIHGLYADPESGEPSWLVAAIERRGLLPLGRSAIFVPVPARDCAGAAGRVWTAHGRASLSAAPTVDPGRPLLREHELALCAHYGVGEGAGRAGQVAGRGEGSVTSSPQA